MQSRGQIRGFRNLEYLGMSVVMYGVQLHGNTFPRSSFSFFPWTPVESLLYVQVPFMRGYPNGD